MSEILAEGRVLVIPDTRGFRAELAAQLAAIKVAPITVPMVAANVGQTALAASSAAKALDATAASTVRVAAAEAVATKAASGHAGAMLGAATASQRLNAGLLGLRTAIGSSAVIGLGALSLGAIAAGAALRASLVNVAQFEQELNTFRAVTGATAEEMTAVSEAASRLGEDVRLPAVSASDAAQAMTELAKAGLSVQDAIVGAEGVLQLATAAQISNADAALISASALNAFGLAGDQAVRVADDLANAANAAQGSIGDFGLALQQVAAVGRQVGFSLEDTTSLLTLLARNGLRGSDAGTSLRTALIRLVAPTKQANDLIQTLGLSIRDAQGNVRPDVFAQFAQATAALGPELRDAATAAIFGQDAIRAVAIAGREGAAGLRLAQFQIDQQGTAAQVAAARTSGLAGSFSALQSSAQTLSISFGDLISGPIKNLVDALTNIATVTDQAIKKFGEFSSKVDEFVAGFPGGKEANEASSFFLTPGKALAETTKVLAGFVNGSDDARQRIKDLGEELLSLQSARVAAQAGGAPKIADQLTGQIQALRAEIRKLKIEAGDIVPPQTESEKRIARLKQAWQFVNTAREEALSRGADTSAFDAALSDIQVKINHAFDARQVAEQAKSTFSGVATAIQASLRVLEIDPSGALATKAVANVRRLIGRLEALAPQSGAAGRKIALSLANAIQEAITNAANAGNIGAARSLKALADRLAAGFAGDLANAFKGIKVPLLGDEITSSLQPAELGVAKAQALGGNVVGALQAQKQAILDLIASKRAQGADLTDLFNQLTAVNAAIKGTYEDIAAQEEEAASNRFQAVVDAIGGGVAQAQNRLLQAQFTEALDDDIAAQRNLGTVIQESINRLKTQGSRAASELQNFQRQKIENALALRKLLAQRTTAVVQGRIQKAEDRVGAAQITETLNDDIRAQINLRKTVTQAIKRLQTEGGHTLSEIKALIAKRLQIRQNIAKLLQDQQDARIEGLGLDVEFAQIKGNRSAEIRARQAEITAIKERIAHEKRGTNEYKRLRNELAEKEKELKELKGQSDKTTDAFRALTFSFLQTQQGFAANLLSNLIPSGNLGGLVGGTTAGGMTGDKRFAPEAGVTTQAAVAKGEAWARGDVQSQIQILRQILHVLETGHRQTKHPEAKQQRRNQAALMEYEHGRG